MSKYKDIHTGQEYDEIPQGKVQPLVVNGQAVTEEAYDKYKSQNPIQLGEVTVSPEKKPSYNFKDALEIPMFSSRRTRMQTMHPRATELAGSSMSTLGELVDQSTLGASRLVSPTQWYGKYQSVKNEGWESINPLDYQSKWYHNKGIFETPSLQDWYNEHPYLAEGINLASDAVIGYGAMKGVEPIEIRTGTETPLVRTRRLSPTVEKHSHITPKEAHIRNQTGLRLNYKGKDENGLHVYSQQKAWLPKNPKVAFKKIIDNAVSKGYKVITHPNLQGIALQNKARDIVISDFGENGAGQIGWVLGKWGIPKPAMVDGARETVQGFQMAMQRTGGKLTKHGTI